MKKFSKSVAAMFLFAAMIFGMAGAASASCMDAASIEHHGCGPRGGYGGHGGHGCGW